ncbi:MAG: dienelactone hydrolase family protein [Xanthobacteraceae bacterium]
MIEQTFNIATPSGRMETFVTHPEAGGPFPPVILYMDVWGIREILFDLARRVATVGYHVLVPDLYYRQGRIRTDYRDERGNAISLKLLSPEQRASVLGPQQKLADAMVGGYRRDPEIPRSAGRRQARRGRRFRLLHGRPPRAAGRGRLPAPLTRLREPTRHDTHL